MAGDRQGKKRDATGEEKEMAGVKDDLGILKDEMGRMQSTSQAMMKELESLREESKLMSANVASMLRLLQERPPLDAKTFHLVDFENYLKRTVWPTLRHIALRTAPQIIFLR
jgi:hypothetical protein